MRSYTMALAFSVAACTTSGSERDAADTSASASPAVDSALADPAPADSAPRAPRDTADSSGAARRGTGASTPAVPAPRTGGQPVGSDSLPSRTPTPPDTIPPRPLPNARPAGTIMVDVNRLPGTDSSGAVAPLPAEPNLEAKPRTATDSAKRRRDSIAARAREKPPGE